MQDTSEELIRDLEAAARKLKLAAVVAGAVGLVIACYAGYKFYNRWKDLKAARERQSVLRNILNSRNDHGQARGPGADDVDEDDDDLENDRSRSGLCVVCFQEQKEVILLDCGHVCVCAECAIAIMNINPICPICRSPIDRVAPAYIS